MSSESSSKKRQHEESESESDDEFVGPMPVDNTPATDESTESKAKKPKGKLSYIFYKVFQKQVLYIL